MCLFFFFGYLYFLNISILKKKNSDIFWFFLLKNFLKKKRKSKIYSFYSFIYWVFSVNST